ncbi:DUF5701 family protein [Nocardioides caldifontis]|uniref:DUF5701 family protein n=1 Tax=Nocardioides caldifontis TaxID=2588938 RepID=UPI0011DF8B89|nr:DUF5701 family protein [Nocardioides caldifontis]
MQGAVRVDVRVKQLAEAGVAGLAGVPEDELEAMAHGLEVADGDVLAVHPSLVPAGALAGLLRLGEKPGFVLEDMTDLDEFVPVEGMVVPDRPLYVVRDVARGDEMANWSPDEAAPAIAAAGRSPLTVSEGISWLLQQPEALEKNRCFMTIGSRKPKGKGLDTRVPALWISGGTGRDGKERRGAPKVGWCWAGNRHTWLGFASTAGRAG